MLKTLIDKKTNLEEEVKDLQNKINQINDEINNIIIEPVQQLREIQGKDTGSVSVLIEGITVKHNIPKKVKWDQSILKELFSKIEKSGDEPLQYMDVKYNITEKNIPNFNRKSKIFSMKPEPLKAVTQKLNL